MSRKWRGRQHEAPELRHPPKAVLHEFAASPLIPAIARVVIGYLDTLSKLECEMLENKKAIAALQRKMEVLDPVRSGREQQYLTFAAQDAKLEQTPPANGKKHSYLAKKLKKPRGDIQLRRVMASHRWKVYHLHWANDSRHVVSVSASGRALVWNAFTDRMVRSLPLRTSYNFSCAFSPSRAFVATGSSNCVQIYDSGLGQVRPNEVSELMGHEGYVSCVRFMDDDLRILSASGDSSCILWDIARRTIISRFQDHLSDVMSVAPHPTDPNVFISGSCDATVKLWDIRQEDAALSFTGHEADINSVTFFPNGNALASGSDDSSCRLWDVRAYRQLAIFQDESILCGVAALSFSARGDRLFVGYDDNGCWAWDVPTGELHQALVHDGRVTGVMVSPDGKALCTSSWDGSLRIWA